MYLIPCLLIFTILLYGCGTVNWDVPDVADPSQFILKAGVDQQAILKPVYRIHNDAGMILKTAGTGFLVSPNGCFLITYHQHVGIIQRGGQLVVSKFKNESAIILGILSEHDLALFKMVGATDMPFLRLAPSPYELKPREQVLLVSGIRPPRVFSADDQAGSRNNVFISGSETVTGFWVYRLTGKVQSGDSGSPLINAKGEAIAVTIGVIIVSTGSSSVYAVPISRKFLRENFAEFHQCE